ncbi:MAG: TolC family protein [Bacteroidales bacterium]|nr:MAG: TolC family protein [Bacteroidales bacterium]
MQKKYLILFLLVLFFSTMASKAQESWSLEQCIKYAFDNNIQIKQQMLNIKAGEGKLFASKMGTFPNLNASAEHSYRFGNDSSKTRSQSNDFSIYSSVSLFNGLETFNTIKKNKFDLLATLSDADKVKNNIALSIASAYLQILYSEELVASSNRQVELSKMQVDRTTVLVKAGSLPEGNLLEIEAQLAGDELQLVNAQNQRDLAYLSLTQFLDIKTPEGFKIQKPNLDSFETKLADLSPNGIFETAQQIMPQIIGTTYRVSSAEKGLNIAKGGYFPSLSLNARFGSNYFHYLNLPLIPSDPFGDQLRNKSYTSVGFSLSIPIFNGWQVRTNISNARISLDRSRLDLENEKNILYKDIQQAYTDALAAQKKLKATQKSLIALTEAFRYSEQKFTVGIVTSVEYTTAKTKLSKAETDLLQAKYELVFKSKILEFYKGIPLSL